MKITNNNQLIGQNIKAKDVKTPQTAGEKDKVILGGSDKSDMEFLTLGNIADMKSSQSSTLIGDLAGPLLLGGLCGVTMYGVAPQCPITALVVGGVAAACYYSAFECVY